MAYYYSDADHHPYQSQYQSQYQPQYHHQYYFAPPQTLAPQTYYYSDGYNCYEGSNGYYYGYGNQSPHFPVAYSVAGYSEPKRVHWEDGGVDRVNMDLVVDREEEEEVDDGYDDDDFDPTPYDGGYDLVAAYGKPLPASDAICYPRSGNDSEVRAVVVSDHIPLPVPVPVHVSTLVSEAIVPVDGLRCESGGDGNESDSSCGSEMSECEDGDAEDMEASDGDVGSSGNGLHEKVADGTSGGYGDREYEKVAVNNDAPNGYESNSESPGFCDGIYGYLPCLNKKKNKTIMSGNSAVENAVSNDAPNGYESNTKSPGLCDGIYGYLPCLNKKRNEAIMSGNSSLENADEDHWRAAAEFIFGSLNPYDGVPENTNYSTCS